MLLNQWVVPALALALGIGVISFTNDASAMPNLKQLCEDMFWYLVSR